MKTTDKLEKTLRKKYHCLCSKLGLTDYEKKEIINSFGYSSSSELNYIELVQICTKLENTIDSKLVDLDKYRKRLIASVGAWLKALGRENNINIIKSIACRAAQKKRFNDIPLEQLRSLYSAFNKKTKDLATVEKMTVDELDILSFQN